MRRLDIIRRLSHRNADEALRYLQARDDWYPIDVAADLREAEEEMERIGCPPDGMTAQGALEIVASIGARLEALDEAARKEQAEWDRQRAREVRESGKEAEAKRKHLEWVTEVKERHPRAAVGGMDIDRALHVAEREARVAERKAKPQPWPGNRDYEVQRERLRARAETLRYYADSVDDTILQRHKALQKRAAALREIVGIVETKGARKHNG